MTGRENRRVIQEISFAVLIACVLAVVFFFVVIVLLGGWDLNGQSCDEIGRTTTAHEKTYVCLPR